jgi:hypothetical protein
MPTCSSQLSLVVLAIVLLVPVPAAAQVQVESSFDSDPEGWTTGENGTAATHQSTGGRPGGYIRAESGGEAWYWQAPSAVTNSFSSDVYNGALYFELTQDPSSTPFSGEDVTGVVLQGANHRLEYALPNPPDENWTPYRIPLRPSAGWVDGDGNVPTVSALKAVLGNLQALRIRGGFWDSGGPTGLDNVRLQATQAIERWVDPKQTYLRTDPQDDDARDAVALNLNNMKLGPGDKVRFRRQGQFEFEEAGGQTSSMVAVFSKNDSLISSSTLSTSDNLRVPGAIGTGMMESTLPTQPGGLSTDIDQDFDARDVVVEIPSGATHLFVAPDDPSLGDNTDPEGDYRLRITFPEPPTGLTATASKTSGSVSLDWNASSTAPAQYRIYRRTSSIDPTLGPGAFTPLDTVSAGSTSLTDATVNTGTTYYYRLTAVDSDGNESRFSTQVLATPGDLPSPPSNLQARPVGDSSVALNWQGVGEAGKYRIYRDTTSLASATDRTLVDSVQSDKTSYTDSRLTPDQTYYYRVSTVDLDGRESELSVQATARPPLSVLAVPDSATVPEGGAVVIEVLGNDIPGVGQIVEIDIPSDRNAQHGNAQPALDNQAVRYVHDGTDNFEDTFEYVVSDSEGRGDTARVDLTIEPITLSSDPVAVDFGRILTETGSTQTIAFTNTGEAVARNLAIDTSDIDPPYSVVDDTGQDTLAAGSTRTVTVQYRPIQVGAGQTDTLTITSSPAGRAAVPLTGSGIAASAQAEISGAAPRGESIGVSVTTDGFDPSTRRLYARRGGAQPYQELSDPTQIPGALVTERGVDYYVVLEDGDLRIVLPEGTEPDSRRRPYHLPVQVDSLPVPVSLTAETYRMVAASAQAPVTDALENSYGPYSPSSWRMLRWDPTAGDRGDYTEYPAIDSLAPGAGFWLVTAGGRSPTLGDGQSVDASTPYQIPLKQGWNQVGTPFGFAVPWDTVLAASGLPDSTVSGPHAYRDSAGYLFDQSVLRPWEGYFVNNMTGAPDTLVVPPVGTASPDGAAARASAHAGVPPAVRAQSARAKTAAEGAYTLRVDARTGAERRQRVWLGLRSGAKAGRDALDVAQPPPVDRRIRLSILESVNGRAVPHAGSFKPPEGDGQTWTLALRALGRGDDAKKVRLQLNASGTPPEGQRRYVLDLDRTRRLTPDQPLTLEPGEERRLKVIVGTRAYAQRASGSIPLSSYENALRANYPNPFEETTTIGYVLEEKREVRITIYNILGQRVRTLVGGKSKDRGAHRVQWDGTNRYGQPVGSGVYFYRIEAGDFTTARKMVLVR